MSFLSPKTPSVPQPTPPPSRDSTADDGPVDPGLVALVTGLAMVGAAVSAVGATIGVEHAGMGSRTRGFLRAQYGSFDTGAFKATGLGVTLGFTVGARTVLP